MPSTGFDRVTRYLLCHPTKTSCDTRPFFKVGTQACTPGPGTKIARSPCNCQLRWPQCEHQSLSLVQ